MTDREKVMRGLMHHSGEEIPIPCDNCPYDDDEPYCSQRLAADALALLKEQEPRVMTLEEVEEMAAKSDPDPVFAEWNTGGTGWIVGSIQLLAAMMKHGYRNIRVWTSRPTPEQMRDTKWEGDSDAD